MPGRAMGNKGFVYLEEVLLEEKEKKGINDQ